MVSYYEHLKQLTSIPAVSGQEDEIIRYMLSYLRNEKNTVTVDSLGNIICKYESSATNAKNLMIFGHMDEVGFIVRRIDENGFLYLERIGGSNFSILPGTRVSIVGESRHIEGVCGVKSYHFLKPEEKKQLPKDENLYVDVGVHSKEGVEELGIHVGTPVCYQSHFSQMNEDTLTNKSMDNRVACALLLHLAEDLNQTESDLGWNVYLVASVQEEFNIRGILPAARAIQPDASIGIDVTPSCDTPDLNDYSDVALGKGPAFTYLNYHGKGTLAGVLPDQLLQNKLIKTAEQQQISYQREIAVGVITENAYILFENFGIPVANVSIPTRYTHSPNETISISDVENAEKLLSVFIKTLKPEDTFGKNYLL